MFLSNFGYAEADVQNSWMEYIPGAIGVVDPSPREHSGRRVQVALSNSSYKQSTAHINVPQSAGAMRVSILDGRGRQIRKLSASHDQTRIVWDGLSDNGTQVSAGNYLVKISAGTVENAGIIVAGR
jgi:flagellar hook assembly protein FlgD